MPQGTIYAISVSAERGELKREVPAATLLAGHGIAGDGHAGAWGRQVTCLSWHSVERANNEHHLSVKPGGFAENILIAGLDLSSVRVGDSLLLAGEALLEVTQIGKEDHPSVVTRTWGVSLLPGEGLFCKVARGGRIAKGDSVELLRRPEG